MNRNEAEKPWLNRPEIKAFAGVNNKYSEIGSNIDRMRELSLEVMDEVVTDYLIVSVEYFANYPDDYLRMIGQSVLDDIESKKLRRISIDRDNGFSTEKPRFNVDILDEGVSLQIPLDFIIEARKRPVMALVGILGSFSRTVDFLNRQGYLGSDLMKAREEATQAHFLKEQRLTPDIAADPDCVRILNKYPKGIYTLMKKYINS